MFPLHQTSAQLCVSQEGVRHCMDVKRGQQNALPAQADAWGGVYVSPEGNQVCCNPSAKCGEGTHVFPSGGGCFAPDALGSSSWTHNTRVELVLTEATEAVSANEDACRTRVDTCESLRLASRSRSACGEFCDLSGGSCATQSATPMGTQLPGYFALRCEAAEERTPPNG